MAVGDLITRDLQYEYDNFLFGSNTSFITTRVEGLLGISTVESKDQDKSSGHGAVPGIMLMRKRIITIDMSATGLAGADIENKLAQLGSVFQVPRIRTSRVSKEFVFQRNGVKRFVWARPYKYEPVSEWELAHGLGRIPIQMLAADPLIYGLVLQQANINLGIGVSTNQTVVNMTGTHKDGADPIFTIPGPATNVRLQNQADGNRTIGVDVVIPVGQNLVIDVKRQSILLNGVNAFQYKRTDSLWWSLLPGNNTIVYSRDVGNVGAASNLLVNWRNTWSAA